MVLSLHQVGTLGCVLRAFAWPGREEPWLEFVESSLTFQIVQLHGAAKEEAASAAEDVEQVLEFGVDEDGQLWLFEWSEEEFLAGRWPDAEMAFLDFVHESSVNGWTYAASIRPLAPVIERQRAEANGEAA
jgi:hypothetical protein